jgi:hypothetical protein
MVSHFVVNTDTVDILLSIVTAMFGRVDMELGQKLKEMTEAKLQHGHDKPHKTAWH